MWRDMFGPDDVALPIAGLPSADTLRQAGLYFTFNRSSLDSVVKIQVVMDGGAQTFTVDAQRGALLLTPPASLRQP